MDKSQAIYSGKVKTLYKTSNPELLVMEFRNDTTAFDGVKKEQLAGKGRVNNLFNAHIMQLLQQNNIQTGFIEILSDHESLVKNLQMLPIECVVRNIAAGSIKRRYGIDTELVFDPPLFEFFLKSDELHDPLITHQHIKAFGLASEHEISTMQDISYKVNQILSNFFSEHGLILVDFKLEFGKFNNQLYLADEISPDSCRIWDKDTKQIYDKDLFRHDLGDVISGYTTAAQKLGIDT